MAKEMHLSDCKASFMQLDTHEEMSQISFKVRKFFFCRQSSLQLGLEQKCE